MSRSEVVSRRWLIGASVATLFAAGAGSASPGRVTERCHEILQRIGGRLGLYALDTRDDRSIAFDADGRYAMASTFKLMLAAAVLAEADRGVVELSREMAVGQADLLPYSPVIEQSLSRGSMTLAELCAAIVEVSDNAAANLLLRWLGGPAAWTQFMHGLGDRETRLDRFELELNSNLPGDPRDTTTPRAMVGSMRKVLTGNTLSAASREQLLGWLVQSTRGLQRIRAGVPGTWRVGDKTGTGANGAVNDLAILWPPERPPILVALYLSDSTLETTTLSRAHQEIGQLLVEAFA